MRVRKSGDGDAHRRWVGAAHVCALANPTLPHARLASTTRAWMHARAHPLYVHCWYVVLTHLPASLALTLAPPSRRTAPPSMASLVTHAPHAAHTDALTHTTSSGVGTDDACTVHDRFITPSSHLADGGSNAWADAPDQADGGGHTSSISAGGTHHAMGCTTPAFSADSCFGLSHASLGTATHGTMGTVMDLTPSPSLDASTNTAALTYVHPHASIFAVAAGVGAGASTARPPASAGGGQPRHFLSVFSPAAAASSADPIAAASSPALAASSSDAAASAAAAAAVARTVFLSTTLLTLHASKLVSALQPTYLSSLAREQVFRHIQGLVYHLDPSLHLFSYGSVPLKTYLPEGDIDIGVVLSTSASRGGGHGHGSTAAHNFLLRLKSGVEAEGARERAAYLHALAAHHASGGTGLPDFHSSPYCAEYGGGLHLGMRMELTHVNFVNAPEVKVLKLQYNHSLLIDISVNTTSALATVCWIEEMEREMTRALMQRGEHERDSAHASSTGAFAAGFPMLPTVPSAAAGMYPPVGAVWSGHSTVPTVRYARARLHPVVRPVAVCPGRVEGSRSVRPPVRRVSPYPADA